MHPNTHFETPKIREEAVLSPIPHSHTLSASVCCAEQPAWNALLDLKKQNTLSAYFYMSAKTFLLLTSLARARSRFLPRDASAERGNATVSRPSVCPSVRPSVCDV